MKYFSDFTSATIAASGNQNIFYSDNSLNKGRIFIRISYGGEYEYSLLYTNIIDTTFAEGIISRKNMLCESYFIKSLKLGKVKECSVETMCEIDSLIPVTFDGKYEKIVKAGEIFCTDPVVMNFEVNDYLCIEMDFSGTKMPCHTETLLPAFVQKDGNRSRGSEMPFPSMVGMKRKPELKIGFLGDSITQGIGTALNSYSHWNALISKKLGNSCACWNLGLGYARAEDAASFSALMRLPKVRACFLSAEA